MDEIRTGILDAISYPVVYADLKHVVRYMNKAAVRYYSQERGYGNLLGKNLFDCHNEESRRKMLEVVEHFQRGGDEVFLKVNKRNERVYMTPVRDGQGTLTGYFERYESNEARDSSL